MSYLIGGVHTSGYCELGMSGGEGGGGKGEVSFGRPMLVACGHVPVSHFPTVGSRCRLISLVPSPFSIPKSEWKEELGVG